MGAIPEDPPAPPPKSRRKYRPGVDLHSFFELFAHERMHNRRHGKPGLYYFGSDTTRPKTFAIIYQMTISTVDHAMQRGRLWVAEKINQEDTDGTKD